MPARVLAIATLVLAWLAGPLAGAQAAVTVRGGDHGSFSRIVFDFTRPPLYTVRIDDGRLVVRFEGRYEFDATALERDPPDRFGAFATRQDAGTTIVTLAVRPGPMRHFTSDGKLVIDIADDGASVPAPPDQAVTDSSPQAPPGDRAAVETREEPKDPDRGGDLTGAASAATATATLTATAEGEDLLLRLHWDHPAPAAIFARAGYLWLVLEGKATLDMAGLALAPDSFAGDRLRSFDTLSAPHHMVLRFGLRDDLHVAARRDGNDWQIRLTPDETRPRLAIDVLEQPTPRGRRLLVRSAEIGAALRIRDPEVGDELDIVPFGESGQGTPDTRSYVQFALLPTAQGLVVERRDSDLLVTREKDGVVIADNGGLVLSHSDLEAVQTPGAAAGKLVDLAAWRRGGRADFVRNEQELLARLARSGPAERRGARWALARFYLAHGAAADALGPLELMRETDPGLEKSAPWKAIHGVALLEIGRAGTALGELLDPSLNAEPEMWLWRGLAAEAAGKFAAALQYFGEGEEALANVSGDFAVRVHFARARAALAEGNLAVADSSIRFLQNTGLPAAEGLAVDYLYGRLAEARGDLGTARARFQDAAAALDRALSAHARFDLVKLELRENNITPDGAISALERLRFAWRGDSFEQEVLDLLARLYVSEHKYREGLDTYRQAAIIATDTPRGRDIARRMSEIFAKLFLEGEADRLSPVVALSLFYDFRELTPLGAEGDRMIRHLADRLVAIDLLDRAAELLKHQVTYRLEGAAQALVAVRLAKIYLLDGKPQKALDILRATRQAVLPADVAGERRLVEARALIELRRFEEGLVLLEGEMSPAADTLRADAYWQMQDWPHLVEVSDRLLGTRWQSPEPLDEAEREHVVREAIALSFLDRRAELVRLRKHYRPLMSSGDLAGVFDVLTGDDPPPAGEVSRIAGELSQSARFRSFLAAYKAEFTHGNAADAGASTNAS